jgi:hypothetical protein
MELRVRNVNDALPVALSLLETQGHSSPSRNGPVSKFDGPVMTIYERPTERVLFNPARDANPFFHLFESLWMLAGRDDVKFVEQFVKRMRTFSDDGKTLHGAYGRRWLRWFDSGKGAPADHDQLSWAIEELRRDPDSRRVVISMWDGDIDPHLATNGGKDVPCNTHIYVWVDRAGELCMTLLNRSNDIIWGAYGANAVHFTYLQEYLAAGVDRPVGRLYQLSNNLHAYHKVLEPLMAKGVTDQSVLMNNPYALGEVEVFPLVSTPLNEWREDLGIFMEHGPVVGLRDPFFQQVAIPMWVAHKAYKNTANPDRFEHAREALANCRATDWRRAALEWLDRREAAANVSE